MKNRRKSVLHCCTIGLMILISSANTTALSQEKSQEKIFPFELKDTLGKLVKAEDFKGKVMVIDFWFTGCAGCIQVAKYLHNDIIPTFEQDTDVVFISISIDINFLQWKKSLKTGLYSTDKQTNLFTMGMGSSHPLFKCYGFSGCPQMLVVNKMGEVITKSIPPDAQTFITIIKNARS